MRELLEIRNEIDEIDKEIVRLYETRMQLAAEVAEYKISTGKQVLDRARELAKLTTLEGYAHSEFMAHGIRELFEQIMSASRKKQYQLLTEHGIVQEPEFARRKQLALDGARIVFQGLEGAYSHLAMEAYFGEGCTGSPVETWRDAMEMISRGEADYAVLPLENSSAGIVPQNYDLLLEYDNCIVGEQIIKIEHALLALPEADAHEITCVYSHPQSLMQCSSYLNGHREWEQISMKNNAFAARKVREDGRRNQAAIASARTADIYGLKVLANAIQNAQGNSTRFIILSREKVYADAAKNISLCFETAHESGSLYRALSHFIYNGVNMVNIQSRPIPEKTWEYRFFVDIEGRFEDIAVQNALRGLKEETGFLKILGTY